ncbi:GntR family transcriptional regulator [Actinomyces sp. B33]|uniref:GntR family transcriptional regulator n=1 Tax=Actinomyces sp. B33 TaxID=2942131 RepID=UPI002342567F|nr:GntR family transcriptional regulator [Actinomyces sp. B33]MDC4233783.1 GntR family transcriptional regulator [Actinomyces sp. B33]
MRIDDTRPIWVQLAEEFRTNIVSGAWQSGSRIPSVRELAVGAGANPNTIQRALGELDREGLTLTERTAGRYVTTDEAAIAAARTALASTAADTYIAAARSLGLTEDGATGLVSTRWTPTTGESR